MQQSSSSSRSSIQKSSPACPAKMKRNKQGVRNPFRDLNIGNGSVAATDCSSNASSVSSVEAPKGCLRFFLSHASSSSSSSKTHCSNGNRGISRTKVVSSPKSAPSLKENSSKRFKFHRPQKLDKCRKNKSNGSSETRTKSDSREVVVSGVRDFDGSDLTPVNRVSRLNNIAKNVVEGKSKADFSGDTKSTSSNSKTPPVQASVSPEIQCGSSMAATAAKTITPVCYGAGFVMSGITDKRKCRSRGILAIGEAKPLSCFDIEDEVERELSLDNESAISELPLPSVASMHWLLSPCNEEDEEKKEDSESELLGFSRLDTCAVTASPSKGFMGPPLYDKASVLCPEEEKKKNCSDLAEETSQFSPASLSSGNVIQTPQSDNSSDRKVGKSWLNEDYKLNSIADRIQDASLSPENYVSIWDPSGSSFQFDRLSSPSDSVDLSHFQKVLGDRTSWLSDLTMGNVSQSQMRISWREGLVSRIFEMDEFDSCRCLSDVEDDAILLDSHCSPMPDVDIVKEPVSSNNSGSTIDVRNRHDKEAEEKLTHQAPFTCAESISTDAGSLARSEDSDWTMCYKNKLFH